MSTVIVPPIKLTDLDLTGERLEGNMQFRSGDSWIERPAVSSDIQGLDAAFDSFMLALNAETLARETADLSLQNQIDLKLDIADAFTQSAADDRYGRLSETNTWQKVQGFGASPTNLAARIYAPWLPGDALATIFAGSTNLSNNQRALWAQSGSGTALQGQCISGIGVYGSSVSGVAIRGESDSGTPLFGLLSTTRTNTVQGALNLRHATSATPAAGFGVSSIFEGSSTTQARSMASFTALWTDPIDANRTSDLTFSTVLAGTLAEKVRITGAGYVGIGVTLPQSPLHLPQGNGTHTGGIKFGSDLSLFRNGSGALQLNGTASGQIIVSASKVYGLGFHNAASGNNSAVETAATGTGIFRNVADSNPALQITQSNASSTGEITQFRNSSGLVLAVRQSGSLGFSGQSSTTTRDQAVLNPSWQDSTDATRTSILTFSTVQNGVGIDCMKLYTGGAAFGGGIPATSGEIRLPQNGGLYWRNAANTSNITGMSYSGSIFSLGNGLLNLSLLNNNVGIGTSNQFGGGAGTLGIANATTIPNANPTNGGVLFVEGGALKWRGSSGTVTTLAPA